MARDDALRLLLIVDYVFDWARDVYRPSILRQLKSLTIGEAHDQVSLASDSDIFSLGRNISNWIQPPPTTVDELNLDERSTIPTPVLGYPSILKLPIPNNKLGLLRSTPLVNSRLSDEDLADTCCVLHPASLPAHRAAALIHEESPQNTISTESNMRIRERDAGVHDDVDFELAAQGVVSWNIILRLSANLKDPVSGFYFGRNKQRCDFVIGQHNINKKKSAMFISGYTSMNLVS
jgi:hypothetical protein